MSAHPRVLMIFIDGLGVGEDNPRLNPLVAHPDLWPNKAHNPGWPGLNAKSLDACLGVEGLPQSATGQTALLTGINAPAMLGKHLQGFPSRKLIEILKRHSIFVRIRDGGLRGTFANAYRRPEDIQPTSRLSVTSHALRASGQPFRTVDQLLKGEAVYHDFTNAQLKERGFDVPTFSPEQAADVLVNIAGQFDFTLYEHFLTDVVAHRGDETQISEQVDRVSAFVQFVLKIIESQHVFLIITSDHGNIEDSSVRTHTRNPVPLLWFDPLEVVQNPAPEDISGITPWVLSLMNCKITLSQPA